MDQDQNNNIASEEAANAEVVTNDSGVPDVQESHKTTYLIAGSVVLGCLILAAAYIYVQTTTVEKEINIQIPVGVEENEPDRKLDFTFEEDDSDESEPKSIEKRFSHTLQDDPTNYSKYYSQLIQQDGVVWLETPEASGDLELFSLSGEAGSWLSKQAFQYWKLAEVDNKPLYFVLVPCDGMVCSRYSLFFVGTKSDGYQVLTTHSDYDSLKADYYGLELSENVVLDNEFVIKAYDLDETIEIQGVSFDLRFGGGWVSEKDFFANSSFNRYRDDSNITYDSEFFAETKYGPVFRGRKDIWNGLTTDLDYGVRLPGGLFASLSHTLDFIWDDRVPRIGWMDGTNNESAYRTDGLSGCGIGGPEIMNKNIPQDKLLLAGYTINQEPIYKVTDSNHPIITRLFTDGDTRSYYEYNKETKETVTFEITKSQFIDEGGVLIYVDEFGLQHVLTHTKYGPQAECAKPVVYLYPEQTTDIRVELDALVTVSEPDYGSGWDVTANPNGVLSVNGAEFESLFWDGYGNGEYPELTEGFVVPTEDALNLMEEHLEMMGFNEKEIFDFVEFWGPHMPNEPYTRFSWIGTIGMENLAKLTINPEPDTLIRAFVDFEGIDEETEIEPQLIPSYERIGFVATEWGGLLKR